MPVIVMPKDKSPRAIVVGTPGEVINWLNNHPRVSVENMTSVPNTGLTDISKVSIVLLVKRPSKKGGDES